MKKTMLFVLSSAVLTAALLTGCGSANMTDEVYPQIGSAAGASTGTQTAADYIGEDEAKRIALEDAQQKEDAVTNLAVTLDEDTDDNDPAVYDVEFIAGNTEYDYEIDAVTGEILAGDAETVENAQNAAADQTAAGQISESKAKKIALKDAGLKFSEVSGMRVVLDVDDDGTDPTVYDVEFYAGNTEYDYEIDAATGEILSRDRDAEHIDTSPMNQTNTDVISESKAKQAALKHAGFQEAEVTGLKVELDQDNGIYEYEVEFHVGAQEYSYEINAVNGEIISYETDYDD